MNARDSRELIRLWLLANEGLASDAQLADLSQRIVASPADRQMLIEMAHQQGWLKWNAVGSDFSEMLAAESSEQRATPVSLVHLEAVPAERGQLARHAHGEGLRAKLIRQGRSVGVAWGGVAAVVVACIIGFISGSRVGRRAFEIEGQLPPNAGAPIAGIMPQATMVSSTGCVWGSVQSGDWLADSTSGDSIQLLEGIAEFNVGASADLRLKIEGPTSVVLASQPGASIAYGKIIVSSISAGDGIYPIESPFGRVLVEPGAEVGLITFGSNAEIHCFRGKVTIESPWLQPSDSTPNDTSLHAGESIVFHDVGRAVLQARRGTADKRQFTPQVAMSNDFLSVSSEYVREVVAAEPVAYWRFEDADAKAAKNEMGLSYQGRIKGEVARVGPAGNQSIELGLNGKHGSLLADESWDDVLQGDFSIELWMKPSHHHLGSMIGFVGEFDPALRRNRHGVLLEACGPVGAEGWRVNRIRFLHRSELTAEATDGVSCFSRPAYEVRRWQHVVATKEGDQLRLYLDGELVHTEVDPAPTPRGLHLVIGQLYTETLERFFIGQLDEIAVYNRSLSPNEVTRHHDLLRPAPRPTREVL